MRTHPFTNKQLENEMLEELITTAQGVAANAHHMHPIELLYSKDGSGKVNVRCLECGCIILSGIYLEGHRLCKDLIIRMDLFDNVHIDCHCCDQMVWWGFIPANASSLSKKPM